MLPARPYQSSKINSEPIYIYIYIYIYILISKELFVFKEEDTLPHIGLNSIIFCRIHSC
jgi:hypothetical protein